MIHSRNFHFHAPSDPEQWAEYLRPGEEIAGNWNRHYTPRCCEGSASVWKIARRYWTFWNILGRLTFISPASRLMEEIKRYSWLVGVFQKRAWRDRLVGALLTETDEKWKEEKRPYFIRGHLERHEPVSK